MTPTCTKAGPAPQHNPSRSLARWEVVSEERLSDQIDWLLQDDRSAEAGWRWNRLDDLYNLGHVANVPLLTLLTPPHPPQYTALSITRTSLY